MNAFRAILISLSLLFTGCSNNTKYDIYIESWDRIQIKGHTNRTSYINKIEATRILRNSKRNKSNQAHVVLGKVLHATGVDHNNYIDDIQTWLISEGFNEIIFELSVSYDQPCIARTYKDGKITQPESGAYLDNAR